LTGKLYDGDGSDRLPDFQTDPGWNVAARQLVYDGRVANSTSLTPADLDAKGANRSLIHIDWMIGSPKVDIDGLAADGTAALLMRAGE
jgi:hypothetical protein